MFYSKSTNGFYATEIHGENIPIDAVEISADEHAELLTGQSIGKLIAADESGRPILVDQPAQTYDELLAAAKAARAAAYREEADPLFFKLQREKTTQEEWLAKIAEIKTRYPDPAPE